MKNILYYFFLLSTILYSCSSDDEMGYSLATIEARTFEVKAPENWSVIEDQGIDTYIGRITNGDETIFFDQGYLSFGNLENVEESEHSIYFERIEINGVPAIIEKRLFPEEPDTEHLLTLYVDNGDMQNRLYIKDPKNEELILGIFKSHKFL